MLPRMSRKIIMRSFKSKRSIKSSSRKRQMVEGHD
jgi:hypothetical protein